MKLFLAIAIALILCVAAYAQAPAISAPGVEELYLARDNGKGKVGEQVSEFITTDVPIYCVVLLETTEVVTVKMNFVAVKVPGVKPDTKVVSAVYTTKEGQNRVNFTGRPDDAWTPGRYRVDIFVNGKVARGLEFDIKTAIDRNVAGKPVVRTEAVNTEPVKATRKP